MGAPDVGRLFTVRDVDVIVPELKSLVLLGSTGFPGAVLTCNTYSPTSVPAVHANVTVEPGNVPPGAGLSSVGGVAAVLAP
jgi:hypothetical protein